MISEDVVDGSWPPHDLLLAGFDMQLLLVADSSSKSRCGVGVDAAAAAVPLQSSSVLIIGQFIHQKTKYSGKHPHRNLLRDIALFLEVYS